MQALILRPRQLLPWLGLAVLTLAIGVLALLFASDSRFIAQLLMWQHQLQRGLTMAITRLSSTPSAATWLTLLGASFGYGVFHAAGPGHGKAVLSTYLITQGGAIRRALALSVAAAFMQALTAIVMVGLLVFGLNWLTSQAMTSVIWVQRASYALIALLGLWLCIRSLRQLRSAYRPAPATHTRDTSAHHGHEHQHAQHHHHDDCGCSHAIHVEPDQTGRGRTAVATVFAIGIRPCSGAILVLGAASLLGHFAAGVAAVLAMAAGTALAVSALGLLSVVARDWAEARVTNHNTARGMRRFAGWAALAGGLIIVALGLSLSFGVTSTRMPLLSSPASQQQSPLMGG